MKAKLCEFVKTGPNGQNYFNGTPGAFTTVICEEVEFTPCGIFFRNVRQLAGRPEYGPHYPSILTPPPSTGNLVITDVEMKE